MLLERGDIYFLYRPRVGHEGAAGLGDVQRLYAVLHPRGHSWYRRLVIGKKRLPETGERERSWAYVDRVGDRPERVTGDLRAFRYETRTRGERAQPPARPVGEGVYAIVEHRDHVHLAYALELPRDYGDVQAELGIFPEASYIVVVMNPELKSPGRRWPRPRYPAPLADRFQGRRYAPLAPAFLDHPGSELVLIGVADVLDAAIGVELDPETETAHTAGTFRDLRLHRAEHPAAPLLEGAWE